MRRGTTPTLTMEVDGCNLEEFDHIVITLKQGRTLINKQAIVEGSFISATFTQEETLSLNAKADVSVQMKGITNDGSVVGSEVLLLDVKEILNEEVMTL